MNENYSYLDKFVSGKTEPLDENINEAKTYSNKTEVFNAFLKGKIDIKELSKIADNMGVAVASKSELEMFLKNKFMQDVMADEHNIPANTIVKKVKELLKIVK